MINDGLICLRVSSPNYSGPQTSSRNGSLWSVRPLVVLMELFFLWTAMHQQRWRRRLLAINMDIKNSECQNLALHIFYEDIDALSKFVRARMHTMYLVRNTECKHENSTGHFSYGQPTYFKDTQLIMWAYYLTVKSNAVYSHKADLAYQRRLLAILKVLDFRFSKRKWSLKLMLVENTIFNRLSFFFLHFKLTRFKMRIL